MRNLKFKQFKSRNFNFRAHFHALSLAAFFAFTLTSCTPEIIGERPSQRAARMRIEESKSIALDLKFDEGILTNSFPIHLTWTPATSALVEGYRVVIYQDGRCEVSVNQDQNLPPTANSLDFLPTKDGLFSFKILSKLSRGKIISSECSLPIEVDQTAPTLPTALVFNESSPTRSSTVTASWTPSTSTDIASASLQLYSDALCLSQSGSPIALGTGDSTHSLPAENNSILAYKIILSDAASNQSTSACSTSIQVDQTPPALASAAFVEASPTHLAPLHLSYGTLVDSYSSFCILRNDTDLSHCSFTEGTLPETYLPLAQGATLLSIYLKDSAGNVSERIDTQEIIYDSVAPNAPSLLSFLQGSTSNSPDVTASWTPSTSSDVVSASLQVYSDGACSNPEGSAIPYNQSDSGRAFTFSPNTTHSYKITVSDAALNQSISTCSTAILIDLDAPSAAMGLGFIESSPNRASTVTASWTPSISPHLNTASLQLYSDAGCTNSLGSQISISPTDSSRQFSFNDGETRAFKITVSNASKSAESMCSSAILIDQTAPTAPTALTFSEGSLSKNASVTAAWTPSASTDVASASFQLYSDAACSTASGAASSLATSSTTKSISVSDGQILSYKISVSDAAGNSSTSACSSAITIDQTAPAAPTSLSFSEGTLSKNSSVTAAWTPSVSTDVASASFQLYSDAACSVASGAASALSQSDISKSISVIDGQILNYKISVYDAAGNTSTSDCSSSITIDQTAPSAPTSLAFSEGSISKNASVTATWTPSVSGDIASEFLQLYSDSSCTQTLGIASPLSSSDSSKLILVSDTDVRSYKISVSDVAGNSNTSTCSSSITIDQTAPAAPTNLTFSEGTLSKNASVTAAWTPSVSTDVASQSFQAYSDASCSTSTGSVQTLSASVSTTTLSALTDGNVRAYKLTVTDAAGNASTSACSNAITIDRAAPAAPTALTFSEGTLSKNSSVTASWTPSVSADVASQSFQAYSDASCSTLSGSAQTLSASASTMILSALTDGNVRAYKLTVTDAAGNSSTSACSSAITIDQTAPSAPTALTFSEGTLSKNASVTASWTPSVSTDFASVNFQLYSDAGCSVTSGAASSLATSATTKSISVSDGQVLSYKISVSDVAGNSNTSTCSSAITIDQTAPAAPTNLTFSEGTLSKNASVTAAWTPSASTDVASASFQLYSDGTCSVASGSASTLALSDTTKSISVSNGNIRSFKLTLTDAAGNASTSVCSSSITIDQTAPAAPTAITRKRDNPSYTWGTYTGIQRPILTVSGVTAGDTVNIYKDSSCGNSNLIGSSTVSIGASTIDVQPSSNLVDGSYAIYTRSIDPAGNASPCSTSHEDFSVETTPMSSAIWQGYTQPWGWEANASLGKIWSWSPSPSFRRNQQNKYPNNQVLQRVTLFSDGACGANGGAVVKTSTPSPVATGYTANGGYINAPGTYSVQIISYRDNGDSKVNCFGTIIQGAPSKLWFGPESVYAAGNQFWFPIQTVDANGSFTNWVAPESVTLKLYTNSSCSVERPRYPAGSGFTGPLTVTTIGGGAQSPVMSINESGEYFVKATTSTLSSDCTRFYILPGEATHLSTSGDGTQIIRGQGDYEPLTLVAYDQFNNQISGYVDWTISPYPTERGVYGQYGNVFSLPIYNLDYPPGSVRATANFFSHTAWNNGATSPTLSYTFNLTVTDPNTPILATITSEFVGPEVQSGLPPDVDALDQFSWLVHFTGGVSNPDEVLGSSFINACDPNAENPAECAEGVAFKITDLGDLDHQTWRLEVNSLSKAGLIIPTFPSAGSILSSNSFPAVAYGAPEPFQSVNYTGEVTFDINAHLYTCHCDPNTPLNFENRGEEKGPETHVGSRTRPYEICTTEDLITFAHVLNAGNTGFQDQYLYQCSDLNLNGISMPPMGTGNGGANKFSGTFNGNGYLIKNLSQNEDFLAGVYDYLSGTHESLETFRECPEGTCEGGLFSKLNGATIEGVQLVNFRIGSSHLAGALAVSSENSVIKNSQVRNTLSGSVSEAGLLIGESVSDVIENCSVSGKVYALEDAGGMLGSALSSSVSSSSVNGTVLSGIFSGGIAGVSTGGYFDGLAVFGSVSSRFMGSGKGKGHDEFIVPDSAAGGVVGAYFAFQYPKDQMFMLKEDSTLTHSAVHLSSLLATGGYAQSGGFIGFYHYSGESSGDLRLRLSDLISAPESVTATGDQSSTTDPLIAGTQFYFRENPTIGVSGDIPIATWTWNSGEEKEGERLSSYHPDWRTYEPPKEMSEVSLSHIKSSHGLSTFGFDMSRWTFQTTGDLRPIPKGVTVLTAPTAGVHAHPYHCNCDPTKAMNGNGDINSPFQVCSFNHLNGIAQSAADGHTGLYAFGHGQSFMQCADLDLADHPNFIIPNFGGTFDGNGYVISNLNQTDLRTGQGLFGITDGATLTRITLFHPTLTQGVHGPIGALVGDGDSTFFESCHAVGVSISGVTESAVGGLIGSGRAITIENSSASGLISGQTAGGLAGRIRNSQNFSSIYRSAFLSGSIHGVSAAGGLVGTFDNGAGILAGFRVEQAAVYGSLIEAHREEASENYSYSGGFFGSILGGPVDIRYSGVYVETIGDTQSSVFSPSDSGGIAGFLDGGALSERESLRLGSLLVMPRKVTAYHEVHPMVPNYNYLMSSNKISLTGPLGVWLSAGPNKITPRYEVGPDNGFKETLNFLEGQFDLINHEELIQIEVLLFAGFGAEWTATSGSLAWLVPTLAPTADTVASIIDLASPIATPTPGSRAPASTPTPTPTPVPVCACDANHASRSGTSEAEAIELCSGDEYLQFLLSSQSDNYFQKFINLCVDFDYSRTAFAVGQSKLIGSSETPFKGSFNGNLNTIANLTLNNQELGYNAAGLFRRTDRATLKNIHMTGPSFKSNYGSDWSSDGSIGALVGYSRNSTIENCWVNGGSIDAGDREYVGGLVGKMESDNTGANRISGSTFQGSVSGQDVGGLVGMITGAASITESGIIDGSISSGFVAGGLIGSAYSESPEGITISKSLVMADKVYSTSSHFTYSGGLIGSTGGPNFIRISDSAIHLDALVSDSGSLLNSGRAYVGGIIGAYPVNVPQSLEICNIQSSIRSVAVTTTNMNPSYPSLAHPIAPEFTIGNINLGTSQSCGNLMTWNASADSPTGNYELKTLEDLSIYNDDRFNWTVNWAKQNQVSGPPMPVPKAFLQYPGRSWK